ncbi:WD40 repeat domain-containing protein [Dictyobacter arantiisoli]|uniref:WD40 repeat domain-containing protein n=1 Tax=Dictyobacter arantiisoli TaxID=2014874 RepID=UPI0011EF3EE2
MDIEEITVEQRVEIFVSYARDVDWSPDGKHIVSGDGNGMIQLWKPFTGECIHTYWSNDEVSDVAWSPQGWSIAAACTAFHSRFPNERLDSFQSALLVKSPTFLHTTIASCSDEEARKRRLRWDIPY